MRDTVGLDAVVFLRFHKLACIYFSILSLLGMVIVIPLNYYGGEGNTGVQRYDISNINIHSNTLYAHVTMTYVFTFLALYMVYRSYEEYVELRHSHLRSEQMNGRSMSIIIYDVPEHLRSDEALSAYFKNLFPESFQSAIIGQDCRYLIKMVETREAMRSKLERAYYKLELEGERSQRSECSDCGAAGDKDEIMYYTKQLREYNRRVEEAVQRKDYPTLPTGFVTFGSAVSRALIASVPLNAVPHEFHSAPAPERDDVYWPSLFRSYWKNEARWYSSWFVWLLLVIAWAIPVAIIASMTNEEYLISVFPWLESYMEELVWQVLLTDFLPTVLIAGLINLIPVLLRFLIRTEGQISYTRMQVSMIRKYYFFLAINFFFVVVFSATVVTILEDVIYDFDSLVSLLADNLSLMSTFFINYIMLRAFASMPLMLFRWGPFLLALLRKIPAWTPSEHVYAERPHVLDHGQDLPPSILVLLFASVYSVIAPLVSPFAIVYFAGAYFVYKYLILYCYINQVESGGKLLPHILMQIITALVIGHICLFTYLYIKGAQYLALLLIPAPIICIFCHFWYRKVFVNVADYLPIDLAQKTDKELVLYKRKVQRFRDASRDRDEESHSEEDGRETLIRSAAESQFSSGNITANNTIINVQQPIGINTRTTSGLLSPAKTKAHRLKFGLGKLSHAHSRNEFFSGAAGEGTDKDAYDYLFDDHISLSERYYRHPLFHSEWLGPRDEELDRERANTTNAAANHDDRPRHNGSRLVSWSSDDSSSNSNNSDSDGHIAGVEFANFSELANRDMHHNTTDNFSDDNLGIGRENDTDNE